MRISCRRWRPERPGRDYAPERDVPCEMQRIGHRQYPDPTSTG